MQYAELSKIRLQLPHGVHVKLPNVLLAWKMEMVKLSCSLITMVKFGDLIPTTVKSLPQEMTTKSSSGTQPRDARSLDSLSQKPACPSREVHPLSPVPQPHNNPEV